MDTSFERRNSQAEVDQIQTKRGRPDGTNFGVKASHGL
jgi:hypothetical protein